VRAGLKLHTPKTGMPGSIIVVTIADPTEPQRWTLSGEPQIDSQFQCSTPITARQLEAAGGTAYGQARVQFFDGAWSNWSGIASMTTTGGSAAKAAGTSAAVALPLAPTPKKAKPAAEPRHAVLADVPGTWDAYTPKPKHILVIGHGFNGNCERLHALGYTTECIYVPDYDRYPSNWRDTESWIASPPPGRNLASLADDIILPRLKAMVRAGRGPVAVLTGSRGGQVSIARLWKLWRGPSVVLNGGSPCGSTPPVGVSLGLMCGGQDPLMGYNPDAVQRGFAAWPGPLVHYHKIHDTHSAESYNDGIGPLLDMVIRQATIKATFPRSIASDLRLWTKREGVGAAFTGVL